MKNNRSILIIAAAALLAVTTYSCKKKTTDDPVDIGGKGGNASLLATPQHHGRNIDSCTVYIKYNTSDLPLSYDDSAICKSVNGVPVATFSGLKKGKYYLFGKGWDTTIQLTVTGGKPYTISEEKSISLNLPVTEGD